MKNKISNFKEISSIDNLSNFNFNKISKGKDFLKIDTKLLMGHINQLIKENAKISMDTPYSFNKEKIWQKEVAKKMDEKKYHILMAKKDEKIVGMCHVRIGFGKEKFNAYLGISVLKEYRGMGLGKYLLKNTIDFLKKTKIKNILIECFENNKIALNLYKKIGFIEIAKIPNYFYHNNSFSNKLILIYKE